MTLKNCIVCVRLIIHSLNGRLKKGERFVTIPVRGQRSYPSIRGEKGENEVGPITEKKTTMNSSTRVRATHDIVCLSVHTLDPWFKYLPNAGRFWMHAGLLATDYPGE